MKLLIDIGNTAVKFATLEEDKLNYLSRFYLSNLSMEELDKTLQPVKYLEGVIISSVVPSKNKVFDEYFRRKYNLAPQYIKVGDYPKIKIKIDDPNELGVDLYCDLIGASVVANNQPVIIIDLGTASKILFLDENNEFASCAIVPGIEMSKKMLSNSTALLPIASSNDIKDITKARNTNDVIASSVYYGHVEMINGLINRFEKELNKKCLYVITGGNASMVAKDLKKPHSEIELLSFMGMSEIIKNRG